MLSLQDFLEKLCQRTWSVDCVEMKLRQPSAPGSTEYVGPGYLRQESDGKITYKLYPTSSTAPPDPRSIFPSLGVAGQIIGPDLFYQLEAMDTAGTVWRVERTLPSLHMSSVGGRMARVMTGEADEMSTTRRLVQDVSSLQMMFFTGERVPGNAWTEVTTKTPDGRIRKLSRLDTARLSTGFGNFNFYNRPGDLEPPMSLATVATADDLLLALGVGSAVRGLAELACSLGTSPESLQVVLGGLVSCRAGPRTGTDAEGATWACLRPLGAERLGLRLEDDTGHRSRPGENGAKKSKREQRESATGGTEAESATGGTPPARPAKRRGRNGDDVGPMWSSTAGALQQLIEAETAEWLVAQHRRNRLGRQAVSHVEINPLAVKTVGCRELWPVEPSRAGGYGICADRVLAPLEVCLRCTRAGFDHVLPAIWQNELPGRAIVAKDGLKGGTG